MTLRGIAQHSRSLGNQFLFLLSPGRLLALSHTTPELLSPVESWDKDSGWTRRTSLISKCWAVWLEQWFRPSCWTCWRKGYRTRADQICSQGHGEFADANTRL